VKKVEIEIVVSNARVVCLGEILFDCLADRAGKSLEEVEFWTHYPGGAPANVASALVKLGTPAAMVSCVGVDRAGDSLVKLLESIGVDITGTQRHPTAPTRQVYVLLSQSNDRSFAGFGDLPTDKFADAYLEASKLPLHLFEEADYLVFGTLELAYPQTREAIFHALELADKYYLKIVLDVNWRPVFWPDISEAEALIKKLWQYVDFLKLSSEEAEWLFGTTNAAAIAEKLDSVEGVVVTNGGEGDIFYCLNEHEGIVSPFSVPVVDTTGAGDAFVAGLVHQLCQRGIASLNNPETVREIVTYACAVGAITTTKPGAIDAQPTASEVEAFLSNE
jgi:fructokinase